MEELRRRRDQADRRRHACRQHDEPENDLSGPTHRHLGGVGEEGGAVAVALGIGDDVADETQAHVHDGEQRPSDDGRRGGASHDLRADAAARVPERRNDDDAEG